MRRLPPGRWAVLPGLAGLAGFAGLAALAALALMAGAVPSAGRDVVVAHSGHIIVTATGLRRGPAGTLISDVRVTNSGRESDQLDAAIASGAGAVTVFHQRVSVGEIPDLASCDGQTPPAAVVDRWLHDGPLLVPGRSSGAGPPATATLTLPAAGPPAGPPASNPPATGPPTGGSPAGGRSVAVTLYFAGAGPLVVRLPIQAVSDRQGE